MKDLWILGCGPSLGEVEIPPDVFTLGINDSYLKHWSPIHVTSDKDALKRDYWRRSLALCHITAIDPLKVDVEPQPGRPIISIHRPERPMLRKSGVFAYWVASKIFKPSRIHLVGYDMEDRSGHFEGATERPSPTVTDNYYAQRDRLLKIHDEFKVESWIWQQDRFIPLERIDFEESTLAGELRSKGIMRYAYGKA